MSIESELAQIDGLRELRQRFIRFILDKEVPYHDALLRIMETYVLGRRCCKDADIEWGAKVTVHGGNECVYVEWSCEDHGNSAGVYIPLATLALELSS